MFDWDGGEEHVLSTVVRSDDGSYYFATRCGARFAQPLHDSLGDGFDEAIEAIIGVTDADQIMHVLEPAQSPPASQLPIIDENVSTKGLTKVSLVLSAA